MRVMCHGRPGLRTIVAAGAVGICSLAVAAPAGAEISGPCSMTINGESVRDRSAEATAGAIPVERHSQVPVSMTAPRRISQLKVRIALAGFSWTVHDEPTTGTSWSRNVDVDRYAKYGVGLYKVSGSSSGPGLSCTGAALVRVEGDAITTVAGAVGLGLSIVSALGLLLLGLRGGGAASLLGGLLLGLALGLGVGVLLQQFAVLYPTRPVAITELAVGAAVGMAIPALRRLASR